MGETEVGKTLPAATFSILTGIFVFVNHQSAFLYGVVQPQPAGANKIHVSFGVAMPRFDFF